ncbi:hypothetical protein [Ruegeria sp. SCSIO 43209]|uniref:hypothetical protein n=1 Tax=Ruegeria sp. SCSIO 43209 TaxID=2793010 RepID=UPI001CA9A419|nr:hypothetical protein [Ruegeria sp. SCSIO 43209]
MILSFSVRFLWYWQQVSVNARGVTGLSPGFAHRIAWKPEFSENSTHSFEPVQGFAKYFAANL